MPRRSEAPAYLNGYFAGKSTADISYSRLPEHRYPGFVLLAPIGGKIPTTDINVITAQREELADAGANIISETLGGNITNILKRMSKLTRGNWTLDTWVGTTPTGEIDRYGNIIKNELKDDGIVAHLIKIDNGVTPHGLIVGRTRPDGRLDRTIFSFQPPNMASEFAIDIPPTTEFAFINSMSGPEWPKNLKNGTKKLKEHKPREIPYVYTPGSTQMDAFDREKKIENRSDKQDAVYYAIDGAEILSVNMDELKMLLEGKNLIVQGLHPTELLHLAKDVLNPKTLLVTDGKEGAYGLGTHNRIWKAEMAPNISEVKSTLGAGDAFIAAAALRYFETGGDIKESLIWGSVSGAIATEDISANGNAPTRNELEERIRNYGPEVRPLAYAA